MALAIDQTPTIVDGTGSAVTTAQFTTTVATEIIIAMATADGFLTGVADTFTITSNAGLTWHLIKRANGSNSGTCEAWYALVTSTQTNLTITATNSGGSGDRIDLQVITLSGHDTTTPIGATGSATKSAAAVTIPITTTVDNSLVFAAFS